MAIRLARAFGATPDIWIRMQAAYDLAQARQHEKDIKVRLYQPQPVAWRRWCFGVPELAEVPTTR
jgi:plasmid maintenance system antidote protein VapI